MLSRMIAEIESYLSSPMRNAGDWWEQEERISLCDLLARLAAQSDPLAAAE
jgi:hypothetical protein